MFLDQLPSLPSLALICHGSLRLCHQSSARSPKSRKKLRGEAMSGVNSLVIINGWHPLTTGLVCYELWLVGFFQGFIPHLESLKKPTCGGPSFSRLRWYSTSCWCGRWPFPFSILQTPVRFGSKSRLVRSFDGWKKEVIQALSKIEDWPNIQPLEFWD